MTRYDLFVLFGRHWSSGLTYFIKLRKHIGPLTHLHTSLSYSIAKVGVLHTRIDIC